MKIFRLLCCLLLASALSGVAAGQDLLVAAASDLQFAFQDISSKFQKETGHTLKLSFGSSGNFFSQIQNGAPFDLYFSADIEYPTKLDAAGLGEPGSLYRYAIGKIVLWTRKDSTLDIMQGLKILQDSRVRKIAVANPEHAPYGQAAVAALRHEKLYDSVQDKFVLGENISQAAQFAESGNADVGILALSLAIAPELKEKGKYYEIPDSLYPPINQGAIILKSSKNKEAAKQFLAFMKRPDVAELMRSYGFGISEPSSKP